MRRILIAAFLTAAAGLAVWFLFLKKESDEEAIARQLHSFAETCSKNEPETAITAAMKNKALADFVVQDCSVSVNEAMVNGTYSPMEFAASMSRARALFSSITGSVENISIEIAPSGNSASVEYSVRVRGRRKETDYFDDARELHSDMLKLDGKWKFNSFEIRKILEK